MSSEFTEGVPLTVDSAIGAASILRELSNSCSEEMGLRELIMNALEALQRVDPKAGCVYVTKDHQYKNKLAVINIGGEHFSEEKTLNHLNTMGVSGNTTVDGVQYGDTNKGVGAKIAVLPKQKDGLLYRVIEKGEKIGKEFRLAMFQGIFGLLAQTDDILGTTLFPYCEDFSPRLKKNGEKYENTATEVVMMGDNLDEDTWGRMDAKCARRGHSSGTGYAMFKWLNHRFFEEPSHQTMIDIYDAKTGKNKTERIVGLKNIFHNKAKFHGNIDLVVEGMPVVAHWCVIPDFRKKGYSSNWISSGFTALTYKHELYNDFHQSEYTKKQDINQCGILVKPLKFAVVFEIPSDSDVKTSTARTSLVLNGRQLEKALFHEEFRKNMPQELKDWQEENQHKAPGDETIPQWLENELKDFRVNYGSSTDSAFKMALTTHPKKKPALTKKMKKIHESQRARNTIESKDRLNQLKTPKTIFSDDPNDPVCRFDLESYALVFGTKSPVFEHRAQKVISLFGPTCLVKEDIVQAVKRQILLQCVLRIFDIHVLHKNLVMEDKKKLWKEDCLESCWASSVEAAIFSSLKRRNKDAIQQANDSEREAA